MPIKRVKAKEGENLSPANVERVIAMLEALKPISKKDACAALNIAYNTTRLTRIIEEYKEQKALDAKRRAANKGKPAAEHEVKDVINEYLSGESVTEIANRLYRPTSFVRNIIENVGVPQRISGENYRHFSPLPEQCISETFSPKELAWSCKHGAACIIEKAMGKTKDGVANLYRIFVFEPFEEPEKRYANFSGSGAGFYSTQPAYDLGRLDHLKQYGIDLERKFKT